MILVLKQAVNLSWTNGQTKAQVNVDDVDSKKFHKRCSQTVEWMCEVQVWDTSQKLGPTGCYLGDEKEISE